MIAEGFTVAVCTPFAKGESAQLDLDIIPKYAQYLRDNGVAGIFLNGTAGEWWSLSFEERLLLHSAWLSPAIRQILGENVPIIVHVTTMHTMQSAQLALDAMQKGADAVSLLSGTLALTQPQEISHLVQSIVSFNTAFLQLAQMKDGHTEKPLPPLYFYNLSGHTSPQLIEKMDLFIETVSQEPKIPNLIGIKQSSDKLVSIAKLRHAAQKSGARLHLAVGQDLLILPCLSLGVSSWVGSTFNFSLRLVQKIKSCFETGDLEKARELHDTFILLYDHLSELYGNLRVLKHLTNFCLRQRSRATAEDSWDLGPVRTPLYPLTADECEAIECQFKDILHLLNQ